MVAAAAAGGGEGKEEAWGGLSPRQSILHVVDAAALVAAAAANVAMNAAAETKLCEPVSFAPAACRSADTLWRCTHARSAHTPAGLCIQPPALAPTVDRVAFTSDACRCSGVFRQAPDAGSLSLRFAPKQMQLVDGAGRPLFVKRKGAVWAKKAEAAVQAALTALTAAGAVECHVRVVSLVEQQADDEESSDERLHVLLGLQLQPAFFEAEPGSEVRGCCCCVAAACQQGRCAENWPALLCLDAAGLLPVIHTTTAGGEPRGGAGAALGPAGRGGPRLG